MPDIVRNFLFTELTADALTDGKPFDGLAVGEFRDMYGREVAFKPGELTTYLANTQAAIEATRGESGELAGLPIDAKGHEKGDGAGWVVGASLSGNLIRLLPKWTEIGRELIGKGIRRFFSATVDTVQKVILGGTLTNWPATRNTKGHVLLRPIELSADLYELADESLDEKTMNVRRAFYDAMEAPDMAEPYICEVFDTHVIVRAGESLYRADYTEADGVITFAARSEWVEVKQAFVEATVDWLRGLFTTSKAKRPAAKSAQPKQGVIEMEITPEGLKQLITETVKGLLPAAPAAAAPALETGPAAAALPADLAQVLGVSVMTEEGKKTIAAWMETQTKAVQEQAQLAFSAQMLRIQRENGVTELVQRVTSGTADTPRGFKNVAAEDLKKHLLALPADEALYFGNLLTGIVKDGLVEFAEVGHGKRMTGTIDLPNEIAQKLDAGTFTLSDLSNPILGLGDIKQYNLSKWQGK